MRWKTTRVESVCPSCGLIRMIPLWKLERGLGVYCSLACLGRAKRVERIERACPSCGKTFLAKPATPTQPTKTYCSRACYHAAQREHRARRECATCGAAFATNPARRKRYCSPECAAEALRQPVVERFWAKVDRSGGPNSCWPWTGTHVPQGYGMMKVGRATERANRVSWEIHHGPIPDGWFVCHNCPGGDNPACVNPAHLFLGTPADNAADMVTKGRNAAFPGSRHPNAKLDEAAVREIREAHASGATNPELARRFGVAKSTISGVVTGASWRHVAPHSSDEPDRSSG